MSASVCPKCQALLTSQERQMANCPKCQFVLPKIKEVQTISDRRFVRRVDLWNDPAYCFKMALACLGLAIAGLIAGIISMQLGDSGNQTISWVVSAVGILFVLGSGFCGFWGLSGGLRNEWGKTVAISAAGLVIAFIQFAFWLTAFLSVLIGSGGEA